MKSYFAYIRVSTPKQGERGSSLQEQRDAIDAFSRRSNLKISAWFEERETAAKRGRRAFNRMLTDLGRKRAAGVIIHKIDRSSRNLGDWARLGELMDSGVEVHFVHDNLDLSTRGGRLSADIQAVVAADYIRNLRDEVRKGRYGRLKQGFFPLPAPIGYLNCGPAKPKAIDPVRGPLVREAFDLYATGRYSIPLLCREMAGRGLTTGAGKPLVQSHMTHMLHNPFYMGLMRLHSTGEVFQGNHEPLISPATYHRVQDIMSGRHYPRVQKNRFVFRRLLKCGFCGRSLTGERQKGHVYYRCHSYACPGAGLKEEAIDEAVRQALWPLQLDSEDVGDFRELLAEEAQGATAAVAARAQKRARELALVEQRLERLTDALLDGLIDREAHDARRKALLTRRLELTDPEADRAESTNLEMLAERFELGFAAYLSYIEGSDDDRREILQTTCSNLVGRGKEVEIAMLSPFAELRKWAIENDRCPDIVAVRTRRLDGVRKLIRCSSKPV
ncbi:MAG TPA: recombinase family protein [Allosphingosinicella sp.]|nr:recombinase family protein [Allosphingosinicella sp.]